MAEKTEIVDLHIRLSEDAIDMLDYLVKLSRLRTRSHYIENMIFCTEELLESFRLLRNSLKTVKTSEENLAAFNNFQHMIAMTLRRLGWVGYRDIRKKEENLED